MSEATATAEARLLELLAGKWIAAAIACAAELGIADALARGPLGLPQLAAAVGCQAGPLERVMRVLAGEGLAELDARGDYVLTEAGQTLRKERLRDLARFIGTPFMWAPWAELPAALRSGRTAFELSHGAPLFEYLDQHAAEAELYHRAVDDFTRVEGQALVASFDFSGARTVIDVGGGRGSLLCELSARWPHLRCIVFDRPAVTAQVRAELGDDALAHRVEFMGGDFFAGLPPADVYVIKHVLHNWGDAEATAILGHCAQGLAPDGRVLLIERLLVPSDRRELGPLLDLEMLVLCGAGRERSKPEFRRLLRRAGLKLLSTHDLAGRARLLVCSHA